MDPRSERTISVIVPTLNEETILPLTLGQFDRLPGDWEVIVADSGSVDRTIQIARAAGAIVVEDAPEGRGAAMNAGADRASGEMLLFLHADTLLPRDAYTLISETLGYPDIAATGFRLKVDRDGWRYRLLSPIGTMRFCVQRTFFGDQAIAVRRKDFDRIGGYHEPTLMEDVDLSRRLRSLGRLRLLPARVTTSARRFERGGVFRTLALMTMLQAAYMLGVSAERLSRWYGHVRSHDPDSRRDVEQVDLRNVQFRDEHDKPVDLNALTNRGPVLLVFLRWLG